MTTKITSEQKTHQSFVYPAPLHPFYKGVWNGTLAGLAESIFYPTVVWNARLQYKAAHPGSIPPKIIWRKEFSKNYPFFSACSIPIFAVIVGVHENLKTYVPSLIAAMVAGGASCPLNALEAALYFNQQGKAPSLYQGVKKIINCEGGKGLFRGIGFYTMRNTIYSIFLNAFGPQISRFIAKNNTPSMQEQMIGSGLAGFTAGIMSHPLHSLSAISKLTKVDGSYFQSSGEVIKWTTNRSWKFLFKGLGPRLVRITGGTMLVSYVLNTWQNKGA